MPATPMNEAAERYSPEIAEAFQPTDTERPATKKSLAVLDFFADQKPIPIVTTTVMSENMKIHGSTPPSWAKIREAGEMNVMTQRSSFLMCTRVTSSCSMAMERWMKIHA